MSFSSLLIHTVTVRSRVSGGTSRYNDAIESYDAGVVTPARVQYLSTGGTFEDRERLLGRDLRQQWLMVFLPPDVVVDALSIIDWGSITLHVDGVPMIKYDGIDAHHIEAICKEVSG